MHGLNYICHFWWMLVWRFWGWWYWWSRGPRERRCPLEQSHPHRRLVWGEIMTTRLGERRPVRGRGRPWWPSRYFRSCWLWALGQYGPAASPWVEGWGKGPNCSSHRRVSQPYSVGWPFVIRRCWDLWISQLSSVCSTRGSRGVLVRSQGAPVWGGVVSGILTWHIKMYPNRNHWTDLLIIIVCTSTYDSKY